MGHNLRFIAPCARTPAPIAGDTHLPEELVSGHVRRLSIFAAVIGGLWTYGLVADLFFVPALLPALIPVYRAGLPIEIGGIVLSLLMWLYLRLAPSAATTKTTAGLAYMIANAFGIALLNNWIALPPSTPGFQLSWTTNLILVYAMIAPTTTRRMLPAPLLAAAMDPLAAWVAYLRGLPTLPVAQTALVYAPNFIAALLAVVPGKIMHGVGRRLREAREMGSYQLLDLLGQGGMGEVWRAHHRLLARTAAIKLVRPEVLGGGNVAEGKLILRRFEREARATAALSSPHTIRIFDYGITDDGTFYYVMELLSGRDLESLVKDFGPVPASRALMLLRQICHSLADAHARGMVHRDIKPANIYVCRMGLDYDFVKVLDFGLVKVHAAANGQTLMTVKQTTTGTPAYMAPEIILGDVDVDRRADVYALGCVTYYLLTGELVFDADTPMKMMMQHVQAQPIPPSQRTELPIPPELDELVLACLQKDPDKRPQNAEALLHLVNRCDIRDPWTRESARTWWQRHLPDMTGPLTLERETGPTVLAGASR